MLQRGFTLSFLCAGLLLISALSWHTAPVTSAEPQSPLNNSGESSETESLVDIAAYPDTENVSPGDTFALLFHARIKPKWHIYWENPGEAGMTTKINLNAPDGFQVGSIQWPRPIVFETGGLTSYGYSGETVLFLPVTAPESLPDKPYHFEANVTYLACKEKCIMQNQTVDVTLPSVSPPGEELRETVRKHRKSVPEPFSELDGHRARWKENAIVFEGQLNGAESITFFPISVSGVELGSTSVSIEDGLFSLRVPVEWNPDNHLGKQKPAVKGVIALGDEPFGPSYRVSVPLSSRKN